MDIEKILDSHCWSIICENHSHGDDSSVYWVVVGYFMSAPFERVIGQADECGGAGGAIRDALKTIEGDSYAFQHAYIK